MDIIHIVICIIVIWNVFPIEANMTSLQVIRNITSKKKNNNY